MSIWAAQWHSRSRQEGDTRHILGENCLPMLFRTREKAEFFLKRLGQREYDLLNMRAQTIDKHPDIWGITLYLKEQIRKLELEND